MSVVAAVDFSENSANVILAAAREARRREVPLVVLHCVQTGDDGVLSSSNEPESIRERMRQDALDELAAAVDEALPADERPETLEFDVVLTGPEEGIADVAAAREASLVVVGASEQGGLGAVMWGTTAENLVGAAKQPILVVPPGWRREGIERILVPVSDTREGRRSAQLAAQIAADVDADIKLLHVVETGDTSALGRDIPPSEERLASKKDRAIEKLREIGASLESGAGELITAATVQPTEASGINHVILEEAEDWSADRIVMATRGHEGLRRWLEGSVTSEILHRTAIPLVVVNLQHEPDSFA